MSGWRVLKMNKIRAVGCKMSVLVCVYSMSRVMIHNVYEGVSMVYNLPLVMDIADHEVTAM